MPEPNVLHSQLDQSVNFISPQTVGNFEARYVRRADDYFVVYLSSQSGCNRGCKMCHLTATRQTQFVNAKPGDYRDQAIQVLKHYTAQPQCQRVHYNFMARGEALSNPYLLDDSNIVLDTLGRLALHRNLVPRFLISTIMPSNLHGKSLAQIFPLIAPEIYYSIYSVYPTFRNKWLPNALPVDEAMDMLADYQEQKRTVLKLHWAFIKGENDHPSDVTAICEQIEKRKLHADINIVRYNPPDASSEETDIERIGTLVELMRKLLPASRVDVVTRVGFDVAASCGMFVGKMAAQKWEVSRDAQHWYTAIELENGPEDACAPDIWRMAKLPDGKQLLVKFWRRPVQ